MSVGCHGQLECHREACPSGSSWREEGAWTISGPVRCARFDIGSGMVALTAPSPTTPVFGSSGGGKGGRFLSFGTPPSDQQGNEQRAAPLRYSVSRRSTGRHPKQ